MRRSVQLALAAPFALLLPASQCNTRPAYPTAVGGATSMGGAAAAGETARAGAPSATGGVAAAGGVAATGGSPAAVVFPGPCDYGLRRAPVARPSLSGWHKDPERAKRRKARAAYSVVAPSVFRAPNNPIALDQLGSSCTGNGIAHALSTHPFGRRLTEDDAMRIYSRATEIDPWPGVFPPSDTGSNGISAWRAAIDLGYYSGGVTAVETIEELQGAVQSVPCPIGVDWWSGMFTPTASGELQMTGTIEGGHEVVIVGWDAELKRVFIRNSWGPGWGTCRGEETGYAYLSAGTLQKLLNAGGEIDCPSIPAATISGAQ